MVEVPGSNPGVPTRFQSIVMEQDRPAGGVVEFQWIFSVPQELVWVSASFVFGTLARAVGLPALVGFLLAGFLLGDQGQTENAFLDELANLGIILLLFSVGLKLDLKTLFRPQVWAVTGLHVLLVVALCSLTLYALSLLGLAMFADLPPLNILLVAFALSFSSTVFAVKVLEERGEMTSLQGRIAIGVLIMQDLLAVVFLVLSAGKLPSPWAIFLGLLIPLRPLMMVVLNRVGHGELLVLYGFLLALGGAALFEAVQLKGDLGALCLGVLIASHPKSDELAKTMLGFKDLFLMGFFLSVGASGALTGEVVFTGLLLVPLIVLKSAGFFGLLTLFSLRARTSLLASFSLTNFSEFGLIVLALGVSRGWLDAQWLVSLSVALAMSFVLAAVLNTRAHSIYRRYNRFWTRWQRSVRLPDDRPLQIGGASVAVVGMGGIGASAFEGLRSSFGADLVGIDFDPVTVANHQHAGRAVVLGDPTDEDFWEHVQAGHQLQLVILALPKVALTLEVLQHLSDIEFPGRITVTAKFAEEETVLEAAGADIVFNVYAESGAGFAARIKSG